MVVTHHGCTMQRGGSCFGHSIHVCLALVEKQLADGLVPIAGRIVQSRIVAVIASHRLALLDKLSYTLHFVIDSYTKLKSWSRTIITIRFTAVFLTCIPDTSIEVHVA